MSGPRGTTNRNVRGSAESRRRRKQQLLTRDGDGKKAPCWECSVFVTAETMVCDRIKPGVDGGTYVLENIRVHCRPCSEAQGRRMSTETIRWKMWRRQGLHRSRIAPSGFRHLDRWHIELLKHYIGFVRRGSAGWESWRYDLTTFHAVTDDADTYSAALYALLCHHTGKGSA